MPLNYKKIYEVYDRTPWVLKDDPLGVLAEAYINNLFSPKFNEELTVIFKQKYPKRKKIDLIILGDDIIIPIRQKWAERAMAYYKKKVKQVRLLRNLLGQIAPITEIVPSMQMYEVRYSEASTYSSQAWGANKYAKGALLDDFEMLQRMGFQCEIRNFPQWDDPKCDWYRYELWANLERWQFDCILRRENYDPLAWAINCWKNGINPRVLNPFLSNEIFDQSLELWNKPTITAPPKQIPMENFSITAITK